MTHLSKSIPLGTSSGCTLSRVGDAPRHSQRVDRSRADLSFRESSQGKTRAELRARVAEKVALREGG